MHGDALCLAAAMAWLSALLPLHTVRHTVCLSVRRRRPLSTPCVRAPSAHCTEGPLGLLRVSLRIGYAQRCVFLGIVMR